MQHREAEPAVRPSLTARAVALGRAVGSGGINDPLAGQAMGGLTAVASRVLHAAGQLPLGGPLAALATGGLNRHATLRMVAVDDAATDAIRAGCEQVVIVGAGYDTRGWRLAALTGTPVIEVDLPAIQQAKRRALAGVQPLATMTFLSADLARTDLAELLDGSGQRTDLPSLWIWEAVAPYLDDRAVRATAASMAARSAPGSRLVMTFAGEVSGDGLLGIGAGLLASAGLTLIGEPLRSAYDTWDVTGLLEEAGWSAVTVTSSRDWQASTGLPRLPGILAVEHMAVAVTGQ